MTTRFNRRVYETTTALDQAFLDEAHDNLENRLVFVARIFHPNREIKVSDRNVYSGGDFFEARAIFPVVQKTIGDFLQNVLEFSEVTIEINNSDSTFNDLMPGGSNYVSWVGVRVSIEVGVTEDVNNFFTIFDGFVSKDAGFSRTVKSFTLKARDKFEDVNNQTFPTQTFNIGTYPDISDDLGGKLIPIVWGDWTTDVNPSGSIPALVVNSVATGIEDVNNDGTGGTVDIRVKICSNALDTLDTTKVYLKRGEQIYLMDSADIHSVSGDKTEFSIRNLNTATQAVTQVEGNPFVYKQSDKFFVRCIAFLQTQLSALYRNPLQIALDIMKTYGGVLDAEIDSSWSTVTAKTSPPENAIQNYLARAYVDDEENVLEYANSLAGQAGCEIFVNKDGLFALRTLHLEDFEQNPSFILKNEDVEKGTFVPEIDERTNRNRLAGTYNFLPDIGEVASQSRYYRNQASIDQLGGRIISDRLNFPNLYSRTQVEYRVQEALRLTSAFAEFPVFNATWRSLLLDIGDFIAIDVKIGSCQFDQVPCMIREKGYDPNGLKIPLKVWSFMLIPFGGIGGYPGQGNGIVGGDSANIIQE